MNPKRFRTIRRLVFVIVTLMVSIAYGDEAQDAAASFDIEQYDRRPAKTFTNENSPPSMLYWYFLDQIFVATESPPDSLQRHSLRRFLAAGLMENSDQDWLVEYFLDRFHAVEQEVRDTQGDILGCGDSRAPIEDVDLVRLMTALDEVEIAVYGKHAAAVSARLLIGSRFDLQKAMSEAPGSFSRYIPNRSIYAAVEKDKIDLVIEQLCDAIARGFQHEVAPPPDDETLSE